MAARAIAKKADNKWEEASDSGDEDVVIAKLANIDISKVTDEETKQLAGYLEAKGELALRKVHRSQAFERAMTIIRNTNNELRSAANREKRLLRMPMI